MPHAINVAIFDTAFHSTIPEEAFMYGLPLELYEKFKIRKYGFHGINHQYLAKETALLLKDKNCQLITCHLGNGSSITAIKNGKSIDTSMGFTPLDGLIMGTRSGGLDPDIILYLLRNRHYTVNELATLLNKKSGLYGISELSSDFRDLQDAAHLGNEKAQLAIDMLAYRIALYIGSYMAILPELDAIVFSGGIGQNSGMLRKKVLDHFSHLLKIDAVRNKKNATVISKPSSKIKVLVIPANEELEIAEETWGSLLKRG
jgi:acetate kinase